MKKFFISLLTILLVLSLILVFSAGCKLIGRGVSEKISEKITEEAEEKSEEQPLSDFPKGFPSSVPIYPDASIVESGKDEIEGNITYLVKLECEGDIEELSEWYNENLGKNWDLGSVSSGDMGDWSEFYAEAESSGYFLTVYLYQDEGSDTVSIDINVQSMAEGEAVAEGGEEEGMEEPAEEEEQGIEGEETEETPAQTAQSYSGELENAKIALVCASVCAAWNIGEHFPQLDIKVYDEYQFDKGYRIQEILDSEKPDIMIIKECAAYFPPDSQGTSMSAYQDLIRDWVNLCRGQGVIPVLTTVVPIDPDNPSNAGQGQLDSILEYNDWIKQYCSDEDISVLDLEKALRISDTNRALNPEYDSGDGLHPNERAYTEKLDGILIPALERAIEFGH